MAETSLFHEIQVTSHEIEIRKISFQDLMQSLKEGYADFVSKPSSFIVLLFIYYPLFALLFTQFLLNGDLLYMAFPMVGGFTLLGPIVCTGIFEMSRRMEQGLDTAWRSSFNFIHTSAFAPILALSIVMMMLYISWLSLAEFIYFSLFGNYQPSSVDQFTSLLLSSNQAPALVSLGTGSGFVFAVAALAISVVAFPLLLDKPASTFTAIRVSVRAVGKNPIMMAVWGAIVVSALVAGTALFLVGLAAVLPILGHATWHLYRKLVAP